MDLNRLREQTRPEHEATEAMMSLMDARVSVEDYTSALCRMLSAVRAWDRWSVANAPPELHDVLIDRQRSGLLEADLRHFGIDPEQVKTREFSLQDSGDNVTTPEFLGAMYVVEGSTLGGQYIAAHMEDVLQLAPGVGDAYFRGYGSETGSRWNAFKAHLAALPETDAEAVIRGARRGFALFQDALRDDAHLGWNA